MSEPSVHHLVDAVAGVVGEDDLPDLLRKVVDSARALVSARFGGLGVLAPDGSLAEFIHSGADYRMGTFEAELGNTLDHPTIAGFPPAHPLLESPLVVPVTTGDSVFGNLYLAAKTDGTAFTSADQAMMGMFATAAGSAIQCALRRADLDRREQWLEASHLVTTAMLAGKGPSMAMRLIAERARKVAGAPAAAITRPNAARTELIFEIVDLGVDLGVPVLGITVPIEGSSTGLAFTTGRRVLVRGYGGHVVAKEAAARARLPTAVTDLDSAVCIPLVAGDEPIGVLTVARFSGQQPFTEREADLAEMFANDAALAVEFARAEDDRRRLAVLEDRDRIARDLHDLVIQRLFAIGLGLEGISKLIMRPEVAARMTGFVRDIDRTMDDLRASIFSLQESVRRPDSLRSELLRLALEAAAACSASSRDWISTARSTRWCSRTYVPTSSPRCGRR
ncbi:GAF domain-containing protein [Fodinicola feengrottensis]|uniref:GAF domain-containing protein n=1 Tax=Fodinicola feengrottensis TaxID=435914 RepID=UPI00244326BF|nr:GAF domain-containing protein [Fodinicola feengrottensis]